jgi:TatD DNase family protein
MLVDIHTHKVTDSGNPAIRNLTFHEADKIFASDEKGLFSLGIHPWNAGEYSDELINKLYILTNDSRLVAIGECGLDKNSKYPLDFQIHVFEQQIKISEKAQKPMIIHCVGCFNELFELKKRLNPGQLWIIHGFRGKPELAQQALKAGCELSFGEQFNQESILITPVKHLFVETDESILAINEIYLRISKLKNCKIEELNAGENLIKSNPLHSTSIKLLKE